MLKFLVHQPALALLSRARGKLVLLRVPCATEEFQPNIGRLSLYIVCQANCSICFAIRAYTRQAAIGNSTAVAWLVPTAISGLRQPERGNLAFATQV